MRKVKIGIIGCGVIGKRHVSACTESPIIELVAVADRIESRAMEMADKYGVKKIYKEGSDLIADTDIEAVIFAFPTAERGKLAIGALHNGKHVLVEKPVGMNTDEVKRMIETRGNLTAGCCSSRYRFMESAEAVTEFIKNGNLGKIREVHCRVLEAATEPPTSTPPEWRQRKSQNGGGILVNWGCYDMDYLLGITGWSMKPKWVLAQIWKVLPQFSAHVAPGSDADSHYSAFIKCEDGTVITLERGEFQNIKSEASWQIVGTRGSLRLNMLYGKEKEIYFDDSDSQKGVISKIIWSGDENGEPVHTAPQNDFAEAILENRQPKTSLEKALVMQKITDAIYRSSEEGCPVEII